MADRPGEAASNSEVLRMRAELERLRAEAAHNRPDAGPAAPPAGAAPPAAEPQRSPTEGKQASSPAAADRTAPHDPSAERTAISKQSPAAAAPAPAAQPAAKAAAANPKAPPAVAPAKDAAAEEEPQPESHFSIARRTIQAAGAFSTSMIVHAVGLIILGLWTLPPIIKEELALLTATQPTPQEDLTEVLPDEVDPAQEVSFQDSSTSQVTGLVTGHSAPLQGGASGPPTMSREVTEGLEGPQVALNDFSAFGVSGGDLGTDVPLGAPGEPHAVVDSYAEAMDRITQEILMMLLKGEVLVMWLFDQSESMKDDQQEIRDRVERVYAELGLTEAAQGDALLTSVGSFGKGFMLHTTKPTHDLEEIRAAIDQVPLDATGLEHDWPAIGQMINHHRKFATSGKRQLALIMVTDESGEYDDNVANLEAAINEAKVARCPVYILGREAVFGYPYAFMNWTHQETQLNFWLQINRGPETPDPEQLQTNGFYRRFDAFPSGFGPFEQSRIARETGGIFFMLPSPEVNLVGRDDRKYAAQQMRPYLPDLGTRVDYQAQRDSVELRGTIWKVITDLNPYNPKVQPHIEMRHSFSLTPQDFITQVSVELEKAKQYFIYLHQCEEALKALKNRRDNEPNARWRANYDLIYAQVIAYKVRLYEYGAYLEHFKQNPKPIKNPFKNAQGFPVQTTHWELTWRQETLTDSTTREYKEESRKLFAKVLADHPGTPWAARAEWEVARGFGVELVEDYDDPRRAAIGLQLPKL